MLSLEDLRSDAEANVTGLLYAAVHVNVAVRDNEKEEARLAVVAVMVSETP